MCFFCNWRVRESKVLIKIESVSEEFPYVRDLCTNYYSCPSKTIVERSDKRIKNDIVATLLQSQLSEDVWHLVTEYYGSYESFS